MTFLNSQPQRSSWAPPWFLGGHLCREREATGNLFGDKLAIINFKMESIDINGT